MHRRMSLGVGLLLLLVILVGAAPVSAEPLAASKATAKHFDLMNWAWEWLTSLVGDAPPGGSVPGGGVLDGFDGGGFMDPNGTGGNG